MKKLAVFLFAVFLLFGITSVANALTLSSVEGTWGTVIGGAPVNYINDVSISYGNGLEDQVRWGVDIGDGQSGLGFTGASPPSETFDIGDAFEVGQLRHFNNPTSGEAASSAALTISLTFSDPSGLSGNFGFDFTINETPNTTGDSYLDRDFIYFPTSYAPQTFEIAGTSYTMQLLGFGPDSASLVEQFESNEGTTNSTLLFGRITTPSVPEPATIFLLFSGLIGLVGFTRRFKNR